jgi:hypothetical protein
MENKELIKTIFTISGIEKISWFFKAEIDWKTIKINIDQADDNYIYWHDGTWNNGVWEDGTWYKGIWEKGILKDVWWKEGTWYNGTWEDGHWNNGLWFNGIWKGGTWFDGIWEDGHWNHGFWNKGTWKKGTWIKGEIYNPKTGKYQESILPPNQCKWSHSYDK